MFKNNKKQGFTLAEILISLGIVGIVAAVTIPAFMNDGSFNDQQLEIAYKKARLSIDDATDLVRASKHGLTIKNICSTASNKSDCIRQAYEKGLHFEKVCAAGDSGCFDAQKTYSTAIGINKTKYAFVPVSDSCEKKSSDYSYEVFDAESSTKKTTIAVNKVCWNVIVDLNGKGTNIYTFPVTE